MSKGLEALDKLLSDKLYAPNKYRKTIRDIASVGQVIIIEKELKRLEQLEKEHNRLLRDYQELVDCGMKSEQEKIKALEIIKSKQVLSVYKDYKGDYYLLINTQAFEIPVEEYDLLKEVVL